MEKLTIFGNHPQDEQDSDQDVADSDCHMFDSIESNIEAQSEDSEIKDESCYYLINDKGKHEEIKNHSSGHSKISHTSSAQSDLPECQFELCGEIIQLYTPEPNSEVEENWRPNNDVNMTENESNFDLENGELLTQYIRDQLSIIGPNTQLETISESEYLMPSLNRNSSAFSWKDLKNKQKLAENEYAELDTWASSICDLDEVDEIQDEYIFWLDNQIDDDICDDINMDILDEPVICKTQSTFEDVEMSPLIWKEHLKANLDLNNYSQLEETKLNLKENSDKFHKLFESIVDPFENLEHSYFLTTPKLSQWNSVCSKMSDIYIPPLKNDLEIFRKLDNLEKLNMIGKYKL